MRGFTGFATNFNYFVSMPNLLRYKPPSDKIPSEVPQNVDKSQIEIKKKFKEDNQTADFAVSPRDFEDFSSIERNIENEILNSSQSDFSEGEEAA
jgi:hypothetical protein